MGRARDWGHISTGRSESIPHRGGEPVAQSAQGGQGGFDARIGARRWRGGLALWRGGVRRRRPAGGRPGLRAPLLSCRHGTIVARQGRRSDCPPGDSGDNPGSFRGSPDRAAGLGREELLT